MKTPNLKLICGHEIYWYGYAVMKSFPPPSTLWCRECKARVKTT
jgi:hypothetical protein